MLSSPLNGTSYLLINMTLISQALYQIFIDASPELQEEHVCYEEHDNPTWNYPDFGGPEKREKTGETFSRVSSKHHRTLS
jgi:hypothetical protein